MIQKGMFELIRFPSRASNLDLYVAIRTTAMQTHHPVLCDARQGVPNTLLTTTDANLDCVFVKT